MALGWDYGGGKGGVNSDTTWDLVILHLSYARLRALCRKDYKMLAGTSCLRQEPNTVSSQTQ